MLAGDKAGRLEFLSGFSDKPLSALPTVAKTQQAVAEHWKEFWSTGGAINLSQSKDPRWKELERRIVLSQYQMAAQSAGSWPSAEDGLMGVDPWSSQFHMEMVWWHLAHYGLWGRWAMAQRALGCYQKFLPLARQLAGQFDYKGAKWGKQVGPEGRTAPWEGSFVLHWQQPHPIFFAELEYRLQPTRATLETWRDIVFATADYMADFPTPDDGGTFHLKPIMPPSEQGVTRDTVFDLAYWRWGLDQAQRWRERLGLGRDPVGTWSASIWRLCRWQTACSFTPPDGPTRTPAARGSILTLLVCSACCRLWKVWTAKPRIARSSRCGRRGIGPSAGVGISLGWQWRRLEWANRRSPSRPC